MKRTSIIILSDEILLRESLAVRLNAEKDIKVILNRNLSGITYEVIAACIPDVILLDVRAEFKILPELAYSTNASSLFQRIIVLTDNLNASLMDYAIRYGVSGYLTKQSSLKEMITAVKEVVRGNKYICEQAKDLKSVINEGKPEPPKFSSLSEREYQISQMVVAGMTSKEIANQLYLAIKTVEVHRHNILRKLKLSKTVSLVNYLTSPYIQ